MTLLMGIIKIIVCMVWSVAAQTFTFGWVRNSPVPVLSVLHLQEIFVCLSYEQIASGSDILTHPKANICTAI